MSPEQIRETIATYRPPDRAQYPELDGYTRDELHEDCIGGEGLYLAARMARTLHLRPGDVALDLAPAEWERDHRPRRSLFALTARKL